MGTYNFIPHEKSVIGHTVVDVIPYFIWGNSRGDSTTVISRKVNACKP